MIPDPRDPFSEVVDKLRKWNPEWYTWLTELVSSLKPPTTLIPPNTVATLPPASIGAGARSFVTDATGTTFLNVVAGGGANKVPVVSDGTNWLIG